MEDLTKISECNKETHNIFDFFLNKIDEEKDKSFIEEILGMPKLPMMGHYNGNEYSLGNILSLVCFQINICQGKDNNEISSDYSDFNLPENIKEYLNIYEEIDIDNNTKNNKNESKFYPKKKLNFYFIISTLPPVPPPKNKNKDNNTDNNKKIYNIVPHLYYNKDNNIDFSKTKRLVFEKAICIFNIDEDDKNDDYKKDKRDISINDLRLEYSSLHLKKGSLAFSPNNLRFELDVSKPLSHFYVVINNKDNDYHSVFYYITCNNEFSEIPMKNILKKSNNIKDIISNMKVDFPNSQNIYENLSKLFTS